MALAPKDDAISNSRTRPVIRESSVNRETVEADLKSDTAGVYALALSALAKYHQTLHTWLNGQAWTSTRQRHNFQSSRHHANFLFIDPIFCPC